MGTRHEQGEGRVAPCELSQLLWVPEPLSQATLFQKHDLTDPGQTYTHDPTFYQMLAFEEDMNASESAYVITLGLVCVP